MSDDLLNQATANAEQADVGGWGRYRVMIDEGGSFEGRWRGQDVTAGEYGDQPVYLLWDRDGVPCYLYGAHKRLVRGVERAAPDIGYDVAIRRLSDEIANGRTTFRYGVAVRPNMDALPIEADDPTADW